MSSPNNPHEPAPAATPQASRARKSQLESRAIWEQAMGHGSRPLRYKNTSAFLLGWDPDADDTGVSGELSLLAGVLKQEYGVRVRTKLLHLEKDPQQQATAHLANFVLDEDKDDTLLIVYYAGHGWSEATDSGNGRIQLSGRLPMKGEEAEKISLEWDEVERTLSRTQSDVLLIFDCCQAGLLCRTAYRGPGRCFQYIGACEATKRTRSAGKGSFTTAMIWALKKMANVPSKPSFSVIQLVETLKKHKHFPRDQFPVLFGGRFEAASENIYIKPASAPTTDGASNGSPTDHSSESISPPLSPVDIKMTEDYLDLRFHFEKRASGSDIKTTAKALKGFLQRPELNCHRVSFIDHCSVAKWAADRWIGHLKTRNSTLDRLQTNLLPPTPDATPAATSPAGPPAGTMLFVGPAQNAVDILDDGLRFHAGKVVDILLSSWRNVPVWHQTSYLM